MPGQRAEKGKQQADPPSQTDINERITPDPRFLLQRARLTPSSLSAKDVIQLQRTIGNRAVRHLLATPQATQVTSTPPTIQRLYIDQNDAGQAWVNKTAGLTGEDRKKADSILEKIRAFLTANHRSVVNSLELYDTVNALAQALAIHKGVNSLTMLVAAVATELNPIVDDLVEMATYSADLKNQSFTGNLDKVSSAFLDVNDRIMKYGKNQQKSPHPGVWFVLSEIKGQLANHQSSLRKGLSNDEFDFGTVTQDGVVIDSETRTWLNDFSELDKFLSKKSLVLQCLLPLSKTVEQLVKEQKSEKESSDWLGALRVALREKELKAGFQPQIFVPLGLLPAKDFFALMTQGHVLDDFGAGQQHGELTHRLQWYAIIHAYETDLLKLHVKPVEVYKKMNTGKFAFPRGGNSIWGRLLDKEVKVSENTYTYPGTLNRDLQELSPYFDDKGVGLAVSKEGTGTQRPKEYQIPQVGDLSAIGNALAQLKTLRVKQATATASKEELGTNDWKLFGVAPQSTATDYEQQLLKENFTVHSQGQRNGTPWKVLQSPSPNKN